MPTALIVGATRGLGCELAKQYVERGYTVFGTARSSIPDSAPKNVEWIKGIDLTKEDAAKTLTSGISKGTKIDIVIVSAGFFGKESFDEPSWKDEVTMYTTSSIAPVFIVQGLVKAGFLSKGSKIMLISSESGSITLRHQKEGGGMYAHHASKAALNMVGKLLSLDLKDKGIAVGLLHPGFMRTEMTKGVGFDKFWDDGGGTEIYDMIVMVTALTYHSGDTGCRSKIAHRVHGYI